MDRVDMTVHYLQYDLDSTRQSIHHITNFPTAHHIVYALIRPRKAHNSLERESLQESMKPYKC